MKKYNFVVDDNDDGIRLDQYLVGLFPELSRSKMQNLIKTESVLVNGISKKSSYNLKAEDKIVFEILQEEKVIIIPQDIELDVIYEDENMLLVNKPSGMLTHPTSAERENTLVNALLYKYGENLSDINGDLRRGILHRLDRNTSGLLMVAKNNKAHEYLAQQFKQRTNSKKYLAVVKGVIKEDSGMLKFPIGRHPKQPYKMAVVPVDKGGKESLTMFRVIKRFKDSTYLELDLKTGRTHQIRVHLSHIKHPIINDTLYGGGGFKVKTQEQVLQSYKLAFARPFDGEIVEFEVEPDEKFKKVLGYFEGLR